ncbi:MAG TPA: inorganic phosphate transporter [Clostridia bacterium]|nr:inorganic phosphate transporter [Clostridia bacterium]
MFTFTMLLVIIFALSFDFINGFHDTANSIATSVSTRVLTPRMAIIMSACLNFVGALMSEKVAGTISKGIVKGSLEEYVIISALAGAIIWNLITWFFGIPSSSSHALIGSLMGAAAVYSGGFHIILWGDIIFKVIIPLFTSPLIGFIAGFIVMKFLYFILRPFTHNTVSKLFSKLQIVSAAFMAYSHGSNDAQKSMGIITLALVSAGLHDPNIGVPIWVKLICAISMAAGTSLGGWKIIKTIGVDMIKLHPIGGFAAETSSAAVIQVMTAFGAPVSTTHVISSSIMGVGSSKRLSAVNWGIAKNIVQTWLLTIPSTMLLGAGVTYLVKLFVK